MKHMINKSATLTTVCVLLSFGLPTRCSSQGTVIFSNFGAPGAVTDGLSGLPAEVGTTFSVGLYFAQDGITDPSQFLQIGPAIHIMFSPGYFYGGTYTAPTSQPGGFGMFQVRVWETSFGSTYEQAAANPAPQNGRLALAGESGMLRVNTGDPTIPDPQAASPLVGTTYVLSAVGARLDDGFVLNVVPEPSAAFLLLLGLPLVLLRRGRSS